MGTGTILVGMAVIGLMIFGITKLVRSQTVKGGSSQERVCENCGKGLQHDTHTCAFCGTEITMR